MKHMHADGLGVKRIAAAVRRSTDTVSKHLFRKCGQTPGKVGPKVCITEAKYKQIYKGYQRLLQKVTRQGGHCQDGEERLEAQVQCQNFEPRIWARGVHFRPLYEKPDLSPQDIKERLAWAEAHSHRSAAQWGRALAIESNV